MLSSMCKAGLLLCLMFVSLVAETKAQETADSTTAAVISPAKRELIKELIALTGDQKSTEALVNSMLDQQEKDMVAMLSRSVDKDSPSAPGQEKTIAQDTQEVMLRVSKRFRELFNQRVNFAQIMDDISYPVYDKFFSESELRDLIAFYKTPTGRKTIEVYPQLFTESMTRTSQVLMPKVRQIMDEIMEEEKAELEKLVAPISPPQPAKTKPRRRRRG